MSMRAVDAHHPVLSVSEGALNIYFEYKARNYESKGKSSGLPVSTSTPMITSNSVSKVRKAFLNLRIFSVEQQQRCLFSMV